MAICPSRELLSSGYTNFTRFRLTPYFSSRWRAIPICEPACENTLIKRYRGFTLAHGCRTSARINCIKTWLFHHSPCGICVNLYSSNTRLIHITFDSRCYKHKWIKISLFARPSQNEEYLSIKLSAMFLMDCSSQGCNSPLWDIQHRLSSPKPPCARFTPVLSSTHYARTHLRVYPASCLGTYGNALPVHSALFILQVPSSKFPYGI